MPAWAVTTGGAADRQQRVADRVARDQMAARDPDLHVGARVGHDGDRRRLRARARRRRQRDERHDRARHRADGVVVLERRAVGELQRGDLREVDHAAAADRDDHVGASALALRQGRVDRRGRHVDGGLGEDRDVQRGERVEDRGEARRLRDHGIGDDQHAAPVLGGDVARRRGHAGSEQHLGRRAQDGEVGHRSVSRNEVIRGLNSSVRSSGEACPQRPEHVAADVRQRLQQRQEAVAQRHDAVLRAVHQQDRRGDPLELRAREREVVDPALARRREQLAVPRLRQRRAGSAPRRPPASRRRGRG